MLRCWSFNPEERPMFIYCLDVLMDLKKKTSDAQMLNISDSSDETKQG